MDKYQKLKETLGENVRENEILANHTYFKIGGPARLFLEVKSTDELKNAAESAQKLEAPFVILGSGANVLVSDTGFDGLVIKNRAEQIKLVSIKGKITKTGRGIESAHVWATSGTLMNKLGRFTIDQGLEGLEFLLSVPGTVGGGIKINSHYEVEKNEFIGNFLESATLYDPTSNSIKKVDQSYFEFAYDYSKIQQTGEIVLDVIFKLNATKDAKALREKSIEDVKRRNMEQPIGMACSGCIFRNISVEDAKRLKTPDETASTGYIIESLGLKGKRIGGAEISALHANYILNIQNATASDVLKLIEEIKTKAKERYDIDLKEEIFYIGDFGENK